MKSRLKLITLPTAVPDLVFCGREPIIDNELRRPASMRSALSTSARKAAFCNGLLRELTNDHNTSDDKGDHCGLRSNPQDQEHDPLGTSELVRSAVERHGLSRREQEALIRTAEEGWDLGIRTLGDVRVELITRLETDQFNIGIVVTALIDRHRSSEWRFFWSHYPRETTPIFTVDLYSNGEAFSLEDAVHVAKDAAFRRFKS